MQPKLLYILWMIQGVLSQSWKIIEYQVVKGAIGKDVTLPCSFTHPRQDTYTGIIRVQWLARASNALPFFQCQIQNVTRRQSNEDCLVPDSSLRFSIDGDPRRRQLSLRIRNLALTDNGAYYCRVELEHDKYQSKSPTQLHVTAPARILSLTWDKSPSDPSSGSLRCVVEGNPLPTITWLTTGGKDHPDKKDNISGYQLSSSIPYSPQHLYTCRAENGLGKAERPFPPAPSWLPVALSAGGVVLVLLLGVVAVLFLRKRGTLRLCPSENRCEEKTKSHVEADAGQASECPIYANNTDVERKRAQSDLDQTRAGEMELDLVYSVIHTTSPTLQKPSEISSEITLTLDEGVHYAAVNLSGNNRRQI